MKMAKLQEGTRNKIIGHKLNKVSERLSQITLNTLKVYKPVRKVDKDRNTEYSALETEE